MIGRNEFGRRNLGIENRLNFEIRIRNSRFVWACSSVRLERTPDKREVDGSTPSRPTRANLDFRFWNLDYKIRNRQSQIRINYWGGVAQLGERLPCTQEVIGSNPFTSTTIRDIGYDRGGGKLIR